MRIDTHQHFWFYDAGRHGWIDASMSRIRNDFLPQDLAPLLNDNNIDGCISVEAHSSEDETNFLLNLAQSNDFIKGIIGWVDLLSGNVQQRLKHFSSFEKFKGVRHAVQSEADINFMLRDDFQKGLSKLKEFDLIYEILIFPQYLPAAVACVKKHAEQKFILNHIAKPFIRDKKTEPWAQHIRDLAQNPNVFCKLSGMVTEADIAHWQEKDFRPYLDVVINAFGSSRVMFGSDWPVCLVAAEYQQVIHIVEDYISHFSEDEKKRIMGLNAVHFYNIH
jgi:L-fucono-1,5-lactonase